MSDDDDTTLDTTQFLFVRALRDMLATDRVLYGNIRYLDGATRNSILTTHLRNNNNMMALLRFLVTREGIAIAPPPIPRIPPPPAPLTQTFTFPLTPDLLSSFLNPVPVVPSRTQIEEGTTQVFAPAGTTCAICQDAVVGSACEIRHCHHMFHRDCIGQWFRESPRCPVCRHDIRNLQTSPATTLNVGGADTDEE